MSLVEIANYLIVFSGMLWGIEMIPQIMKTIKTKNVKGISLSFYVICYIAYLLYIFANSILQNWIIVFSHIPSYIGVTTMVCLILKYNKRRRKK